MKKAILITLVLTLVLGISVGLIACNKGDTKQSGGDAALAKVAQAFNGVERSMSKDASIAAWVTAEKELRLSASGESAFVTAEKPLYLAAGTTASEALSTIRALYTQGDKQSHAATEIEYDQPPMRQFQYLKAVFEEMGEDYSLGTKYYYDITGAIYFDMETGFRVAANDPDAASHRYEYVFEFSMSIDLKENDLIFAEVSFGISLSHGSERYETSWYVSFDLDYDFDEKEPTYTLLMLTDNKEGALAFLDRDQGYEYDYVEVKKGSISEWRKFVMSAEEEIVWDETHSSFEDYIEEGIAYSAGTAKWLKDGAYYKITQMTDEKNRALATAFADGLGMNSTAIKASAFLGRTGEENKVIDTYYQKICSLYGDDILYDLVCKKADKEAESDWQAAVSAFVPQDLPSFDSSSASFHVERGEEGVTITVTGADAQEFASFAEKLQGAGFLSQENGYFKVEGESVTVVFINANEGLIFVTVTENSKQAISIPYGVDYDDLSYTSYDNKPIDSEYALSGVIASHFSQALSEKSFATLEEGSAMYEIRFTVSSESEESAESLAAKKASEYGGKYIMPGWTNRYNNTINYCSLSDGDVIVLIALDGSGDTACLSVYVVLVPKGTASSIVDAGNGESGGNENGGENGGNENGGGENGGNENGGGENGGNGGGEQMPQVQVTLYYLNKNKEVTREAPMTCDEGAPINFESLKMKSGECAYRDSACMDLLEEGVIAYAGMEIYIWGGAAEPTLGTFSIYEVNNGVVAAEPQTYATTIGETTYYGYSFTYVVYWDAACTQMVPLDYTFTMTEEGIVLYKDVTEDYVPVKTNYYLNEVLAEHREGFYRKGLIYTVINNRVIDFDLYTTAYDISSEFYLGEGKGGTRIRYGDVVAFTANETTITGYGVNKDYGVYTVMRGETELGKVVTDQPQYITFYGAVVAMSNEVDEIGGKIILKDAKTLSVYRHYNVWNGRSILTEECPFEDTYQIIETGGQPNGESEIFFTDVNCISPITLDENRTYSFTSSTTLYSPFRPY